VPKNLSEMTLFDRRSLLAGAAASIGALGVSRIANAQSAPEIALSLEKLAVTPKAPALDLADMAGQKRRIEDYRGKAVVVAFWATWCGPCLREMPALQALRARLAGDNVEVLAVNYGETPERIKRFLRKSGVADLPILLDTDEEAAKRWFVGNLPIAYAVDPGGTVQLGKKGEVDWNSPDIDAQLRALAASAG